MPPQILDIGPNLNITEAQILHVIGFTAPASRYSEGEAWESHQTANDVWGFVSFEEPPSSILLALESSARVSIV
ncbi:hypothetical protein ACOSQ4_026614 [Xanthoceras sorbifolium]